MQMSQSKMTTSLSFQTTVSSDDEHTSTDVTEVTHYNATNISMDLPGLYGGLQLFILIIGVIGNILILVVLHKSKGHLQPMTLALVKHQSVIDAVVCFIQIGYIIIPSLWVSGIRGLDVCLCHLFHTFGKCV